MAIIQLLVALVLLFSTVVDGKITLDEPVQYPRDFYELYDLVETGANGWVFDECEITGPRLHWDSAVNLFENTSKEFEDKAFGILMLLFLASSEYSLDFCGDREGKPILFGPGVNEFFAWYGNPEQHEQERLPMIAKGVAKNLAKIFRIFGPSK